MFSQICQKLTFPAECTAALTAALSRLESDAGHTEALRLAARSFLTWGSGDPLEQLTPVAQQTGLPIATLVAVTLVCAVPGLQKSYADRGIAESIMWDTLVDLTCKLREYHDLEGIWGVEPITWYQRLFTLRIIKLGRLEFEPIAYKWDTPYQGISKGDPVMNIHIPSCGSMPMEQVMEAFRLAHQFFKKDFPSGIIPIVAASWLLYPPICEGVLKKGSNLEQFYHLFDIVEQYADPDNKNFWRIFNIPYGPGALDKAPADTSLRRGILEFMRAGHDMGVGRAAFLFDGEKIIRK